MSGTRAPAVPAAGWAAVRAGGLGALLLATGCLAPPVMLPTPREPVALERFPPRTERVELPVEPGTALRGVWVPARGLTPDGGPAPVVLDLLESGGTITTGARDNGYSGGLELEGEDEAFLEECGTQGAPPEPDEGTHVLARRRQALLPLLGFGSLCVDYTGVGASDGERSSGHLLRDARAAWAEALRRAGGDPARVVLRGTSIGTLAIAALLRDGVRPGAVILVAPVRAETLVHNAARAMDRGWQEALAGWLLRRPVDADLLGEVRRLDVPLLVVVPQRDEFLPAHERAELLDAVQAAGGCFAVREAGHIGLALAGRDVLAIEAWFLGRLPFQPAPARRLQAELEAWQGLLPQAAALAPDRPARWRLEPLLAELPLALPGVAGAIALADHDPLERREFLDLLAWLPDPPPDPAALARLADLDDPAGRLAALHLRNLRGLVPGIETWSAALVTGQLGGLSPAAQPMPEPTGFTFSVDGRLTFTYPDEAPKGLAAWISITNGTMATTGLSLADRAGQMLRLALKAAGVVERASCDGDGRRRLEVQQAGAWQDLTLAGWTP